MYDPEEHAQELGLDVVQGLMTGRWGEYRHAERTVVMPAGLTAVQRRCTLAHEIVHAEHEDHAPASRWWDAKAEQRADRIAALRLVPASALAAAVAIYPGDKVAVAMELGVTRWLLEAALRYL